jgi:hypothetical protein
MLSAGLARQEPKTIEEVQNLIFFDGITRLSDQVEVIKSGLDHYLHKFDWAQTPKWLEYATEVIGRFARETQFGFWAEVSSYLLKGLNIAVDVYKDTGDRQLAAVIMKTIGPESFTYHAFEVNPKTGGITETMFYQSETGGRPAWVPLWTAYYMRIKDLDRHCDA